MSRRYLPHGRILVADASIIIIVAAAIAHRAGAAQFGVIPIQGGVYRTDRGDGIDAEPVDVQLHVIERNIDTSLAEREHDRETKIRGHGIPVPVLSIPDISNDALGLADELDITVSCTWLEAGSTIQVQYYIVVPCLWCIEADIIRPGRTAGNGGTHQGRRRWNEGDGIQGDIGWIQKNRITTCKIRGHEVRQADGLPVILPVAPVDHSEMVEGYDIGQRLKTRRREINFCDDLVASVRIKLCIGRAQRILYIAFCGIIYRKSPLGTMHAALVLGIIRLRHGKVKIFRDHRFAIGDMGNAPVCAPVEVDIIVSIHGRGKYQWVISQGSSSADIRTRIGLPGIVDETGPAAGKVNSGHQGTSRIIYIHIHVVIWND